MALSANNHTMGLALSVIIVAMATNIHERFLPAPPDEIGLEVQPAIGPAGEPGCSMRHTIEGRTHGPMRFLWPLLVRWLHDQVLEELLDRAESHARGQTITTAKPAMWIRLLRRITPSDRADADRAARDRGELLSRPSAA